MNLYEVLHVSQGAPEEIIKLAYKGLAQKYHPDRYNGSDANEIMVKIREAYETLIDPIKRKHYDQFLTEQAQRKQQQEESVRSQKADFKQKTTSNSQQKKQKSDPLNFKINISIDFPSSFSPFINIKNWLISKKKIITGVATTCIAFALIITIAIVATSYLENTITSESDVSVENIVEPEDVIETNNAPIYEDTVEDTVEFTAADQAVMAAGYVVDQADDQAAMAAEHVVDQPASNLKNNPSEIKNAINQVFSTFKETGVIGIKELITNCYSQNQNVKKCMYLDYAGRYINESGVAAGLPPHEFFEDDILIQRVDQNFYTPNGIAPEIGIEHIKQTKNQTYEIMETLVKDYPNEI